MHYSAHTPPSTAYYSSPEQKPDQAESRRKSQTDCWVHVGTCVNPVQGGSVSCPVQWNRANWKLRKFDLVIKTHPVKWNQYHSGRLTGLLKSLPLPPPVMDSGCFWGYFYPLRCFSSASELHFYWKDFISIINGVRNYTHSSLVQKIPPHANSHTS